MVVFLKRAATGRQAEVEPNEKEWKMSQKVQADGHAVLSGVFSRRDQVDECKI